MLEELNVSCVTLLGQDSFRLYLVSFRPYLMYLFLFVDFVLYPLTVINISYEYDYLLNLMGLSSESTYLRWSWEP